MLASNLFIFSFLLLLLLLDCGGLAITTAITWVLGHDLRSQSVTSSFDHFLFGTHGDRNTIGLAILVCDDGSTRLA